MRKKATILPLIMLGTLLGLTGCFSGNEGTFHYTRNTTIGQELMDLQDARERGSISEEEYEKLKKEIMKGGPIDPEKFMKR